ncbi:unnamed protein product [Clonostachys rhizophaga]|uniref:Uncharacterized protein n=1 Tax=Clonostachys rhizophaga TaxID=160324 RepID=A0A9N9VJX3_9HYPO|nr:unnamed protein product [Clonostachys rhizophaga]
MMTASADKDCGVIFTCTAHFVEPDKNSSYFYERMNVVPSETAQLASDLFDSGGCLRPEYRSRGTCQDVTSWDNELDSGDIFVFERFKVDKPLQRKGSAKSLCDNLIGQAIKESQHFSAIVAPGALESEYRDYAGQEKEKVVKEQVSIAVQFELAQGFRRDRGSNWLALT